MHPNSPPHKLDAATFAARPSMLFDQAGAPALATRDVEMNECHWPFGEGETFRFCGAPATVGYRRGALTYCARCAGHAFASRARSSELLMKAA